MRYALTNDWNVMLLIEDIKRHYEHENYPPEGPDLDYDFVDGTWVQRDDGYIVTERVFQEVVDTLRWGSLTRYVYKRGSELVAVQDVEPATEYQSWGDYGPSEIFSVRAVEVTVTKYVKE